MNLHSAEVESREKILKKLEKNDWSAFVHIICSICLVEIQLFCKDSSNQTLASCGFLENCSREFVILLISFEIS